MGKISPVSSKYIINATIDIEGVVDRPDVIGAVFGQTEGLLGAELELRELQRSGRIGRIEVNSDTRGGRTQGTIIIPSSMDKAETAIVAAALEVIQRIGPCNARIKVVDIEDVRVSKRNFVVERAKELLKNLIEQVMPDSQEITDEVAYSVRMTEIQEYGRERLPAGPAIDESDEIIVVEGRADVLNLLKHGFKNAIALNGTSCPQTVIDLSRKKEIMALVDGDRGGDLIVKELISVCEIDFVSKAPDGKEIEELTKKELHKALRGRITVEQAKMELYGEEVMKKPVAAVVKPQAIKPKIIQQTVIQLPKTEISQEEKLKFGDMLESLIGTRGAFILDEKLNVLGKVPCTELIPTLRSFGGVYAVVFDGMIDSQLMEAAEKNSVKHIIGMDSKVKAENSRVNVVTVNDI